MKILILDRHEDSGLRDYYQRILQERGHETISAQLMINIDDYLRDGAAFLSSIDVAVVHPHWSCMQALEAELQRRDNFRMIVYKVAGKSEYGDRVMFREFLSPELLVRLVETGRQ